MYQSQHSILACTGLGLRICYGNSGYETLSLISKCAVMKVESFLSILPNQATRPLEFEQFQT